MEPNTYWQPYWHPSWILLHRALSIAAIGRIIILHWSKWPQWIAGPYNLKLDTKFTFLAKMVSLSWSQICFSDHHECYCIRLITHKNYCLQWIAWPENPIPRHQNHPPSWISWRVVELNSCRQPCWQPYWILQQWGYHMLTLMPTIESLTPKPTHRHKIYVPCWIACLVTEQNRYQRPSW